MKHFNIARQNVATIALLAAMSAISGVVNATIVFDSLSKGPLPRASVFDCNSNMTATCDDNGKIPAGNQANIHLLSDISDIRQRQWRMTAKTLY